MIDYRYIYLSLAGFALETAGATPSTAGNMPGRKLNVLFVMADDLRPELGCYGVGAIHTPNIDRFAARSVCFDNAFCNAPVSGASRASLLTGMYPNYPDRFVSYTCRASADAPQAVPISQWLKDHGYHTVSNGKIMHHIDDHAASWSEEPWRYHPDGYDVYWAEYNKWELWLNSESARHINPRTMRGPFCESADVPDSAYDDGHVLQKTIRDLQTLRDRHQPFFLACGFWKPHLPFCAPKKYWDLYPEVPLPANRFRPAGLPEEVRNSTEINAYASVSTPDDRQFLQTVKRGYYACVSYVDALFGQLLDAVDALGLSDNTVIILFGDHGWDLGEHQMIGKHNLMRVTTRVPLLIHVPGMACGHTASFAELVDLYPTICELCGIGQPEGQLDGKSLVPVLTDPKASVKDGAYIQWEGGDDLLRGHYHYARWERSGHRMLFDHAVDPDENRNRAEDTLYRRVVRRMDSALDSIRQFAFRKH